MDSVTHLLILAIVAGVAAQWLSHKVKLPAIVPLIGMGRRVSR